MNRRRSVGSVLLIFLQVAVCSTFVASPAHAQSEDQVKAAFLFNFARYVEWPSSAFASGGDPIRIKISLGSISNWCVDPHPGIIDQIIESGFAPICQGLFQLCFEGG